MAPATNSLALLVAAAASVAAASGLSAPAANHAALRNVRRATDTAPDGYVPDSVDCPSDRPSIRNGSSAVSDTEADWVEKRRNETIPHIRDLLSRLNIPDFDSDDYLSNVEDNATALPNIAIAVSGGGYRAMLNGAGALKAFDDRINGSTDDGNLGGLLQSTTYLAGLSGGAWLVGSLYTNNFTTVQDAQDSDTIWHLENSILEGPEQYGIVEYYTEIFDDADDKDDEGYDTSLTDYWGRALSYQLVDAEDGGPGYTWHSVADDDDFSNHKAPLPFLITLGRDPNETIVNTNSTVYEFSPWELGSSDPTLQGYVPLEYVGSKFDNGSLDKDEDCIAGMDNVGFVMGTSSTLFNQFILYLTDPDNEYVPDNIPDWVIDTLTAFLNVISNNENDIADWNPNPFKGFNPAANDNADSATLTLVDGGEDLQNIPFHPVIRNERDIDVVFAVDSSADTSTSWPDGQSMQATYERSLEDISAGTSFPSAPGRSTFINLGLNQQPTFFGCDSSNYTTDEVGPLIVYLPNYPYVYNSNVSTFQLTTNTSERDAIIQNGWYVATMYNGTRDEDWPSCVGCAMLHRSFERTGTKLPDRCSTCMDRYCWNGTVDNSDPKGDYEPEMYADQVDVSKSSDNGHDDDDPDSMAVGILGSGAPAAVGMAALVALLMM